MLTSPTIISSHLISSEQIQADLGISRKVLTERLNHPVEHGVLERRRYDRRPRFEYILTEKGTELVDLLMPGRGHGRGRGLPRRHAPAARRRAR